LEAEELVDEILKCASSAELEVKLEKKGKNGSMHDAAVCSLLWPSSIPGIRDNLSTLTRYAELGCGWFEAGGEIATMQRHCEVSRCIFIMPTHPARAMK
jgi:hypothetical protein